MLVSNANTAKVTRHDFEASYPVTTLVITLSVSLAEKEQLVPVSAIKQTRQASPPITLAITLAAND